MAGKELARPSAALVSSVGVDISELPTLELDDVAAESEAALIARGAAYAREYLRVRDKAKILLRNLGVVCLALRIKHDDMLGRTPQYRDDVHSIYQKAGILDETFDRVERERMQGSVRWHIGNLLRRHLTPRELESYGLMPTSPLERQQDDRAARAALVVASRVLEPPKVRGKATTTETIPVDEQPPPSPGKVTADHLRLAHAMVNIGDQLSPDVIDREMTPGQRAKLDGLLADLEKRIAELRQHTSKPKKRRSRA